MADTVNHTQYTVSIPYAYRTPQKLKQKQKLRRKLKHAALQAGNLSEPYDQNSRAYEDGKSRSPLAPSLEPTAPSLNLMGFWLRHKPQCRPIGEILTKARAGVLSGVVSGALPDQFFVTNQAAALAAISRGDAHA